MSPPTSLSKTILAEITNLQDLSMKLKDSVDTVSEETQKFNVTSTSLENISKQVIKSIDEISSQIDEFKV
jgi:methyl-accepting chemotaxis protein